MKTPRTGFSPLLAAALLAVLAPATAQVPNTLLHSFFEGPQLGWSVAADGNTVVASVPDLPAKVFDATTGRLLLTLTNSGAYGNGFGGSDNGVAISGSRVVVGAYLVSANSAEAAFVYDLASGAPRVPVTVLTNPSPQPNDWFGFSVAISGTRVAVAAPYDDTGADSAGIAYVYDLTSPTPAMPVLTLTNPSPRFTGVAQAFGNGIALSGSRLVVGSYSDNKAYVYELDSANPAVPVFTLTNPTPAAYDGDRFGSHVDISGTRVIIGAYTDNSTGSAYIYDLASATPTVPVVTLTNPTPAIGSFGYSVSILGTRAVVGGLSADNVYVYEIASATPAIPVATLRNPTPSTQDRFGSALALAGETVVVGAPNDYTRGISTGAVYIFGPRPVLSIGSAAPGLARISWTPATTSGFRLQYKNSVTSTNWTNAPSGATNPATIQTMNLSRFYRLRQP